MLASNDKILRFYPSINNNLFAASPILIIAINVLQNFVMDQNVFDLLMHICEDFNILIIKGNHDRIAGNK